MNNNIDMKQLLNMINNMDKKDLQASLQKANEIMNSKDRDTIINELKKNMH